MAPESSLRSFGATLARKCAVCRMPRRGRWLNSRFSARRITVMIYLMLPPDFGTLVSEVVSRPGTDVSWPRHRRRPAGAPAVSLEGRLDQIAIWLRLGEECTNCASTLKASSLRSIITASL